MAIFKYIYFRFGIFFKTCIIAYEVHTVKNNAINNIEATSIYFT